MFQFIVKKDNNPKLHYDLQLEIGSNPTSWSITKGPTLDPKMKRLSIESTEHNDPDSAVWDRGNYLPEIEISKGIRQTVEGKDGEKVMKEGLKKGEIKFLLNGKKLQGSFALVKTPHFGPKNSWLLIKHTDEFCQTGYDANDYDFSAKSKKNLAEITKG